MSGIEPQPLPLPRFRRKDKAVEEPEADGLDWSREERRAVVLGSIGAVLVIAFVFLAAAALVIGLMLTVWR